MLLGGCVKVKLTDVSVTKLNGTCLTLISQFTRALKAHNGVVLRLTDPNIVGQVVSHAKHTTSPELRRICNMLLIEIKNHLSGEQAPQTQFTEYRTLEDGGDNLKDESGDLGRL